MLLLASATVLLLIVLNGIFAMSELAVVSSKRTRLQSRADKGNKGAEYALKLSQDPTRFLSAVQVGITLIGILAGAYGQATIAAELDVLLETNIPALAAYSEGISTGFVVVILTYLSLIVGELVPKRLALIYPESIAAAVSRPLSLLAIAMGPFVTLLTGLHLSFSGFWASETARAIRLPKKRLRQLSRKGWEPASSSPRNRL